MASSLVEESSRYYIGDENCTQRASDSRPKNQKDEHNEDTTITPFNNNYGVSVETLKKIQELNSKITNLQKENITTVLKQHDKKKQNKTLTKQATISSDVALINSTEDTRLSKLNEISNKSLPSSSSTLSSSSTSSSSTAQQQIQSQISDTAVADTAEVSLENMTPPSAIHRNLSNISIKTNNKNSNIQQKPQQKQQHISNNNNNNNNNNYNNNSSTNDANGRSAALERAYVHDVYENCEEPTGPIRPRVAQFLSGLEPGSIVCDVGCGNGRYLAVSNPYICTIGVDRCYRLAKVAKDKGGEVSICDNLELPFRDESFDAVLSLAVVHHFATTERRVGAIRELARILRIGGRVVITVWALEQRHRRFESQDVLIPWQPPKDRTINYSDEEDEDDYLPPYHAYTEDSTNSSRSAGDGDSSSLSSSSPGESCYSFVRKAIQKLARGRKHPWFLESWNSKETKNESSLDYEDAKDLPIELRRLEDFEDFPDPPLSAGLKSRSLGSILNPPPRQIVRSRSSVPSLGGIQQQQTQQQQQQIFFPSETSPKSHNSSINNNGSACTSSSQPHLLGMLSNNSNGSSPHHSVASSSPALTNNQFSVSPTKILTNSVNNGTSSSSNQGTPTVNRRPKLIKQKQSLCEDDFQLPDTPFHLISNQNSSSLNNSTNISSGMGSTKVFQKQNSDSKLFLRKQSSLNEELMAGNRLKEKEKVRKRIQKQMSLNEAFLCRSMFTKRLQIIREGFTTKLKSSTGSLERVTKSGLVKIMKNIQQASHFSSSTTNNFSSNQSCPNHQYPRSMSRKNSSNCQTHSLINSKQAMQHCIAAGTHNTSGGMCSNCNNGSGGSGGSSNSSSNEDQKTRRHSRESGSDSSKDSSLQSDTSIESEDSFASVIFIPKTENCGCSTFQQQQQQIYHNHKYSSNSSSGSNGTTCNCDNGKHHQKPNCIKPPTSPLIMPCPPTPAHSPAALNCSNNPTAAVQIVGGMLLSPPNLSLGLSTLSNSAQPSASTSSAEKLQGIINNIRNNSAINSNRFTFDEEHIIEQQKILQAPQKNNPSPQSIHKHQIYPTHKSVQKPTKQLSESLIQNHKITLGVDQKKDKKVITSSPSIIQKITRQSIKDLPPIPKFRKQTLSSKFPIVRRSSVATPIASKFLSLELFNPATDDLDSDSSEPSSPDSIDSVINTSELTDSEKKSRQEKLQNKADSITLSKNWLQQTKQSYSMDDANKFSSDSKLIEKNQELFAKNKDNLVSNVDTTSQLNTGLDRNSISKQSNQELVDFAEQLSAQLLRRMDEKPIFSRNLSISPPPEEFTEDPYIKTKSNDTRDMTDWREELRERRLNLANLSTQPSQQQSPISSSTSSLSSQTRSFTIQEEDEDQDGEASYSPATYYDQRNKALKYKRGQVDSRYYNINPETAFLIQDQEDEEDEIEHNVIMEEDEEVDDNEDDNENEHNKRTSRNTIRCQDSNESQSNDEVAIVNLTDPDWVHSNSSNSLDSPSQSGGSTTHHRYYHVFREGELDALINHHVTSLHIVSSYYERASWCVVAEKVQVWTI